MAKVKGILIPTLATKLLWCDQVPSLLCTSVFLFAKMGVIKDQDVSLST